MISRTIDKRITEYRKRVVVLHQKAKELDIANDVEGDKGYFEAILQVRNHIFTLKGVIEYLEEIKSRMNSFDGDPFAKPYGDELPTKPVNHD